jgi:murein DD-endopeptidase MepM/ murein hydrolase activator NlpD
VKKIDIHFFSEKTERSKVVRVSSLRPVWWIIGSAVAIGGFFWFSPLVLWEKITDGRIFELYQQNQEIQETISDIRNTSSLAEKQIKASAALRDSAVHMGGTYAALAKQKKETSRVLKQTSSFSETYKTFRSLRDSLLANPERAAALPLLHPLKKHANIVNHFEMIYDHFTEQVLPHRGVDFSANVGDTVIAPGAGVVSEVRTHRGLGLSLKLEHTDKVKTFYAHLDRVLVSPGMHVKRGTPIALVGKSGRTTGPSLHYEVRLEGQAINPEDYFITP